MTYHIKLVERLSHSSGFAVGVSLRLTYEDGSSSTRSTYFVYEDGEWKHALAGRNTTCSCPASPTRSSWRLNKELVRGAFLVREVG